MGKVKGGGISNIVFSNACLVNKKGGHTMKYDEIPAFSGTTLLLLLDPRLRGDDNINISIKIKCVPAKAGIQ